MISVIDLEQELAQTSNEHIRKIIGLAISALEMDNPQLAETMVAKAHAVREESDAKDDIPRVLEEFAWVANEQKALGRKFEAHDLVKSRELQDACSWYLRTGYNAYKKAPFPFMEDMVEAHRKFGLSPNQLKGVANCLANHVNNHERDKYRKSNNLPTYTAEDVERIHNTVIPQALPVGYYTVVLPDLPTSLGGPITLRIRNGSWNAKYPKPKGTQVASYLFGPSNTSDYRGFATVVGKEKVEYWLDVSSTSRQARALSFLLEGGLEKAREAGEAYAFESGNCYVCNRLLTMEESKRKGIGPICESR